MSGGGEREGREEEDDAIEEKEEEEEKEEDAIIPPSFKYTYIARIDERSTIYINTYIQRKRKSQSSKPNIFLFSDFYHTHALIISTLLCFQYCLCCRR